MQRIPISPIRALALMLAGQVWLSADLADVAANGYTIAFASFAPLKTNIFIANGNGEDVKPLLTKPDVDYNPAFSRDGAWIVFTSHRGGSADIYRIHPDGSGLQRVTDDPAFDDQGVLSPDGKFLAFVSTRGGKANIWLLDMQSRKLKNLTPTSSGDFRPAWSPDGQWIAFSSDRDSTFPKGVFSNVHTTEIYVIRSDGSDTRRMTTGGDATAGSPSWSPDGSQIIYYYSRSGERLKVIAAGGNRHGDMEIVSLDFKTGERKVLRGGPGEKWSPKWLSPTQVAYYGGGSSGGVERTEGPSGARGEFWNVNWSPDGKVMVFHREADSSWPPFQQWASLDASFRLVRTGIFPSYSPSGDRLICNSARAGILHNSILLMNADGSGRRVLFDDPEKSALAPVWSPRGDQIAFGLGEFFQMVPGRQGVTSQLAIVNSDGGGLRVLTVAGDHAGFPSWSPDGKQLVYRTSGNKGKGLRILDIASNRVTELTNGPQNDNFPAWSPLGRQIAFTSDRDGDYEIYTIRPDGTGLKRLTQSRGNDAHLAWSRDGRWIAFASARTGYTDEVMLHPQNSQANGEIFAMRVDGSNIRRLTENQFEDATPAWRASKSGKPRPR